MSQALTSIQPMHGPVVPAENWKMHGMTPDGRQLFTERFRMNKAIPDMIGMTDDEVLAEMALAKKEGRPMKGERRWRQHPVNNQPLVPMNRRRIVDVERMFFVASEGNFNQGKIFYVPPTAEELEAAKRDGKVATVLRSLAEALVDKNSHLSVEEIVARMVAGGPVVADRETYEQAFGEPGQRVEGAFTPPDPDIEYPLDIRAAKGKNKRRWKLSNGQEFEGTKDEATAMELEVLVVREAAQDNEF